MSNGVVTLTNRTARTTAKANVPFVWESTSNLADETRSFEFGYSETWGHDWLYLDGSDVGYYRAEDL